MRSYIIWVLYNVIYDIKLVTCKSDLVVLRPVPSIQLAYCATPGDLTVICPRLIVYCTKRCIYIRVMKTIYM